MSLKSSLGFFGKVAIKLFAHPAIDYAIDNTAAAWAAKTPIKADDHLVKVFLRPAIHDLFVKAMNGFKGISVKEYFINLLHKALSNVNSVEILDLLISDLQARKAQLKLKIK